jgi:hypothetical protein
MKATITIRQYDNGITIVDTDDEGNEVKLVSLDRNQIEAIGRVIWDHISKVADEKLTNEVTMDIEFKPT